MTDTAVKRTVKGRRPQFNDDPAIDNLHGMVMALAAELAVVHDRLDSVERIADAKGIMLKEELAKYSPTPEVHAEREQWRQQLLKRMFYVLREQVDDITQKEDEKKYADFLKEIA